MSRRISEEIRTERRKAAKDFLKSLIFPVILCAIILGAVFFVITYQNIEEEEEVIPINAYAGDDTPVVMESDNLLFTMDPLTTQFTVKVKSSGKTWHSNPDGVDSDNALQEEKNKLKSTLLMSYAVQAGLETVFDTYEYSVQNGIYDIEQGEDYVKVNYSLGKVEKEYVIPPVCTKENFKKWCDAMDNKEKDLVQQYYKKYDIKKLNKKDNKEELLANYPLLEEEVLYILRDTTKDQTRKQMQGIFEKAGYTYQDFENDKELDNSSKSSDKPIFNVNVIYRLEGDDLVVEVPFKELQFKKEYPIYTITPLPYFGAGDKDDVGYMLVPEGGGSIINFNNGKVSQSTYYANIFGWDMCLSRNSVVHDTRAYFGVFGIAHPTDSVICIMEDGRSYASVQADISGKTHSYNYVNAIYSICSREKYDVGDIANSDIYQYNLNLPDESIVQRYRFVDSGSYVDMAKDYQKYLKAEYGQYLTLNQDTEAPIAIELVGAVDKIKQIVGIPVSRPHKLTTYKEAADIIKELKSEGMNNMSVKLSGWCNGGVAQNILKSIRPIGALGSKKDLQYLSNTAKEQGVNLYLNGITQYEHESDIFDGFFSYADAAKLISKERAEQYIYSAITYAARENTHPYFLLHTELADKMVNNLTGYASKLGTGVSFEDLGQDISSDFYKKKPYSREAVLSRHETKLQEISDSGVPIMVNMGNDYAAPYASMVTNMDLRGSEYTILDETVPFYQLALHGYVNYTGKPINICGNMEEELLYSAEYGAGLQFNLMAESSFALQKTMYMQYYGSAYADWHDRMLDMYQRYNSELGHTFNQEMSSHDNLSATLSLTEYEDGTKVYVNYGFEDATADGVTIPARDYLVVR